MSEEEPLGGEEAPEEEDELQEHDDAVRAVASSMVSSWGYNREAEQIEVSFVNGHSESYDCSPTQWEEAKDAVSPGRFMHANFL